MRLPHHMDLIKISAKQQPVINRLHDTMEHALAYAAAIRDNAQDDYTQMDICTGTGSSVGQVVAACSQDIDVRFEGERAGDPSTLIGNPSRAKALLGWQPRFGLKDIVNSVRWHHEP